MRRYILLLFMVFFSQQVFAESFSTPRFGVNIASLPGNTHDIQLRYVNSQCVNSQDISVPSPITIKAADTVGSRVTIITQGPECGEPDVESWVKYSSYYINNQGVAQELGTDLQFGIVNGEVKMKIINNPMDPDRVLGGNCRKQFANMMIDCKFVLVSVK